MRSSLQTVLAEASILDSSMQRQASRQRFCGCLDDDATSADTMGGSAELTGPRAAGIAQTMGMFPCAGKAASSGEASYGPT